MVIMGFQVLLSNEAYNSMDWSKDSLAKRQSVAISEGKWQIFAFWDMIWLYNPIETPDWSRKKPWVSDWTSTSTRLRILKGTSLRMVPILPAPSRLQRPNPNDSSSWHLRRVVLWSFLWTTGCRWFFSDSDFFLELPSTDLHWVLNKVLNCIWDQI